MKKGIFLLFDMSKGLSDGHFYMSIKTPDGEKSFQPSIYRLLKEKLPNASSDEINEILYQDYECYNYFDDDFMYDSAQNILAFIFKIPIAVFLNESDKENYSDIQFYSTYSYNPKIQRRVSYNNEVLLYSTEYPNGSKEVNGEVIKVNNPEEATGPYFPLEDLIWDSGNNIDTVNEYFSSLTLAIGADYYEDYNDEAHTLKKRSEFPFFSLTGFTNKNSDIAANTIYFLFSEFFFVEYRNYSPQAIDTYLDYFHRLKMMDEAAGLVFDVRGNIGGFNIDRQLILGDIFSSPFLFGYQINKIGAGRHEHSLPIPLYIYPESEYYNGEFQNIINKPIVILTNGNSQSNSETLVHIVKAINGKQIGGKTLGVQGFYSSKKSPFLQNAGAFNLNPFINTVLTVSEQLVDVNYKSHEGIGLIPDIPVPFNVENLKNGFDDRLNAAFKCIKESF